MQGKVEKLETTTEETTTGEALSKTVETLTTGVTCQQHKERLLAKPEEFTTRMTRKTCADCLSGDTF